MPASSFADPGPLKLIQVINGAGGIGGKDQDLGTRLVSMLILAKDNPDAALATAQALTQWSKAQGDFGSTQIVGLVSQLMRTDPILGDRFRAWEVKEGQRSIDEQQKLNQASQRCKGLR